MERRKAIIMGAAGRDFHNFNVFFRENELYDVVAFTAVDSMEGDSARGDWVGRMPGIVRPLLKWETDFIPGN